MDFKTIQTNCGDTSIMKELYELTLKDDHLFYFSLTPNLAIKVSKSECFNKVINRLKEKEISYEVNTDDEDSFISSNLDIFVPLFHAHSLAAIKLNEIDYRVRSIHRMYKLMGIEKLKEASELHTIADLSFRC